MNEFFAGSPDKHQPSSVSARSRLGLGDLTAPSMTLRDYFAGQALAGMLAKSGGDGGYSYFAIQAYEQADAMLQARKDT